MLEDKIHHLALVEDGKIVGLITGSDLLEHQASSPIYLSRTLENLEKPATLKSYARDVAAIVLTLFRGGLGAVQIGQIVSNLNDTLVKRLLSIAEGELGPAPADFAWIVFGSEGRLEQTLLTDQDNALIYGEESEAARAYFRALAERVVNGLIEVGFPPCAGGFMATNWCKPLEDWRRLLNGWIHTPKPQALLDATIFFDFRSVAGGLSLSSLEQILSDARGERRFLTHMTRDALRFRPPLGFFNRIRTQHGRGDLKKNGLQTIVGLARVAALAAGSRERSTLERLAAAGRSRAILTQNDANELADAFQFLSSLRLRHQLTALENNQPLEHTVRLKTLSLLERRRLRDVFVMIRRIQDGARMSASVDTI